MGIDISCECNRHVGDDDPIAMEETAFLSESYHGAPYPSMHLVAQAFETDVPP